MATVWGNHQKDNDFFFVYFLKSKLSAHVAGFTGKAVTRGVIEYIVALDPAGPLFNLRDPKNRVAATDGVYVEVIHTNSGQQGFRSPIGQADFYPNFGRTQPNCQVSDGLTGGCSHGRVVFLFAESITDIFTATECKSYDEVRKNRCTPTGRTERMGGPYAKLGVTGIFHLTTNSVSPFSRG